MDTNVAGIKTVALQAAAELMKQATEACVGWSGEVEAVKKAAETDIKTIRQEIASANNAHQLMIGKLNTAHSDTVKKLNQKIDERSKQLLKALRDLEAKNGPLSQSPVVQKTITTADKGASKLLGGIGKGFGYLKSRIEAGAKQ